MDVLKQCNKAPADVDEVLLAGGIAQMPRIQSTVRGMFESLVLLMYHITVWARSLAQMPRMQAAKAPTPGTTRPSAAIALAKSLVTSTSAPTRCRARSIDRTLPEP